MLQDPPVNSHYGFNSSRDYKEYLEPSEIPRVLRGKNITRTLGSFALAYLAYMGAERVLSGVGNQLIDDVLPRLAQQETGMGAMVGGMLGKLKGLSATLDSMEGIETIAGKRVSNWMGEAGMERGTSAFAKRYMQAKAVRWMRNLPTMLPAMYISHRGVLAPPGQRLGDDLRSGKMKWYNPADWAMDFAATSSRMLLFTAATQIGLPAFGQYARAFAGQNPYISNFTNGFIAGTQAMVNKMEWQAGSVAAGFQNAWDAFGPVNATRLKGFPGRAEVWGEAKTNFLAGYNAQLSGFLGPLGEGAPITGSRLQEVLTGIREAKSRRGYYKKLTNKYWKDSFVSSLVAEGGLSPEAAKELATQIQIRTPYGKVPASGDYNLLSRIVGVGGTAERFSTVDDLSAAMERILSKQGLIEGGALGEGGSAVVNAAIKADQYINQEASRIWDLSQEKIGMQMATVHARGAAYIGRGQALLLPGSENFETTINQRILAYFGLQEGSPEAQRILARGTQWAVNFLRNNKVIATDESQLYNFFGLRKMTGKEFFDRGLMPRQGLYDEFTQFPDYETLLAGVPGLYINSAGQTVNLSGIYNVGKGLYDFASRKMKLPILQFNPIGITGGPIRFKASQMPWAEIHDAYTIQPMLGGVVENPYMAYKVSPFSQKLMDIMTGTEAPEAFRPYQITPGSAMDIKLMWGLGVDRYLPEVGRGRIKSFFNISEEQPKSIFDYAIRRMNREMPLTQRFDTAGKTDPISKIVNRFSRQNPSDEWVENLFKKVSAGTASDSEINEIINFLTRESLGSGISSRVINRVSALNDIAAVPNPTKAWMVLDELIKNTSTKDLPVNLRLLRQKLYNQWLQMSLKEAWLDNPMQGAVSFGNKNITQLDMVRHNVQQWFLLRSSEKINSPNWMNYVWNDLLTQFKKGAITRGELRQAQGLLVSTRIAAGETLGAADPTGFYRNMLSEWGPELRELTAKRIFGRFGPRNPLAATDYRAAKGIAGLKPVVRSPLGRGENIAFVPKLRDVWKTNKLKAAKGIVGLGGPGDIDAMSTGAIPMIHLVSRLDRYREIFGVGLKFSDFKNPMDMLVRGWGIKTMLPLTLGVGGVMAVNDIIHERTGKSPAQQIAKFGIVEPHIQISRAGAPIRGMMKRTADIMGFSKLPFSRSPEEIRQSYEQGETAIRRGRWWPLGGTPFRGGRIEYFAPNWYRRLGARAERNRMIYGSTPERLFFNWGPGKFLDPYHWEKKWYHERPYPVSGEMFTGPWGPMTGMLNLTVGSALKPRVRMHDQEMARAMRNGMVGGAAAPGMGPSIAAVYNRGRINLTQPVTVGRMMGWDNRGFGTTPLAGGIGSSRRAVHQQISFLNSYYSTVGNMPVALTGGNTISGAAGKSSGTMGLGGVAGKTIAMGEAAAGQIIQGKRSANSKLGIPYPAYPILSPARMFPMQQRAVNPAMAQVPGFGYGLGEFGYQLQEIAGIYGFGFGAVRSMFGGEQDFSPSYPMLQSSSRMYGSERSFWDLGLGGLGDINMGIGGGYSNLELSELIRRFIPHRRRQINEYNPIPNLLGKRYPWLPQNYFTNFGQGDPYINITRGEYRLPGPANLALYGSHPDAYGSPYGLEDITRVLGDVAPWSQEYKNYLAVARRSDLSADARGRLAEVAKQVAAKKKPYEFHPYRFAKQNFSYERIDVTGMVEGNPNLFTSRQYPGHPMRLAGVRFPIGGTDDTFQTLSNILKPGTGMWIKRDASTRKPWLNNREQTIDVVAYRNGRNVNRWALESGYGVPAKTENAVDALVKYGPGARMFGAAWERFAHMDTPLHSKFLPIRTAQEEYERRQLYGTPFQQWQHPIHSFLAPHLYKNIGTRGPMMGMAAGAIMGVLFGAEPKAKGILTGIGAGIGLAAGTYGKAYQLTHGGQRWVPKDKRRQMAIDEYTDILEYLKWTRMYHISRAQAIQQEGMDPQVWLEENKRKASRILSGESYEWSEAKMGSKPQRGPAERSFDYLGPMATMAIQSYQRAKQTAYGVDLNGDWMNQYMAFTKRRRPFFNDWAEAPKKEHKRILSGLPRLERRILESKWGLPVEPKPDLINYFRRHELPPPNWQGWLPEVNMEEIKLKIINHEGLDYHDMGYYPQEMQEAEMYNYAFPDFDEHTSKRTTRGKLENLFWSAGIPGTVRERPSLQPGYQIRMGL